VANDLSDNHGGLHQTEKQVVEFGTGFERQQTSAAKCIRLLPVHTRHKPIVASYEVVGSGEHLLKSEFPLIVGCDIVKSLEIIHTLQLHSGILDWAAIRRADHSTSNCAHLGSVSP
ncbi:MAG TPA: hypothetical protein VKT29_16310, partial [Terriglobales bacterium]|nr:hypothetical protein [Terriglobales bacterium]